MVRFEKDGEDEHRLDRVTARIAFGNGAEQYSDITQNDRPRASLDGVGGTWSEGEFETVLEQTGIVLRTQAAVLVGETTWKGLRVEVFEINVPAQDSPWDLDFGWEHHHTPFRSRVSILKSTGELVRVERAALGIPRSSGVAEIRWAVELANAKVGGNTYLVPTEGEYLVRYAGL